MATLKSETEALNLATMVKDVHDLDCVVCPFLKVRGGKGHIIIRCHHPDLCVPVRMRTQLGEVFPWCPRRKTMEKALKDAIVESMFD